VDEVHIYSIACQALKQGKVIAYPTEAVWGLGADPFNEDAVREILSLKQRALEKGLILVAGSLEQLGTLKTTLNPHQQSQLLADRARPTTWLIEHHNLIPTWITGGHRNVAIRISQHPTVQALCQHIGGMIVSTSANPAGLPPAKNITEAKAYFGSRLTHYVAGEIGQSDAPSAIINLATGEQLR